MEHFKEILSQIAVTAEAILGDDVVDDADCYQILKLVDEAKTIVDRSLILKQANPSGDPRV